MEIQIRIYVCALVKMLILPQCGVHGSFSKGDKQENYWYIHVSICIYIIICTCIYMYPVLLHVYHEFVYFLVFLDLIRTFFCLFFRELVIIMCRHLYSFGHRRGGF